MPAIPTACIVNVPPELGAKIEDAGFVLHPTFGVADRTSLLASFTGIRAVITNGTSGLKAPEVAALPDLEVICAIGAGYEGVDLVATAARGIAVSHGPGTNAAAVADHAMALLLSTVRDIRRLDAGAREGQWMEVRGPRPGLSGKRLGILGYGRIGEAVASRAVPFGMSVAYCSRTPKDGSPYRYYPTPEALAAESDFMVVATPGGAATRHIVDARVLDALGPAGFLVNIGRGSVVATDDLVAALKQRRIAGAALDVFENEPGVPESMLDLPNLIVTPHVAGLSPEAVEASYALVLRNLMSFFGGHGLVTPIPG